MKNKKDLFLIYAFFEFDFMKNVWKMLRQGSAYCCCITSSFIEIVVVFESSEDKFVDMESKNSSACLLHTWIQLLGSSKLPSLCLFCIVLNVFTLLAGVGPDRRRTSFASKLFYNRALLGCIGNVISFHCGKSWRLNGNICHFKICICCPALRMVHKHMYSMSCAPIFLYFVLDVYAED